MAPRRNRLANHIHPSHLFAAGVAVIVAFLLQSNPVVRVGQVLLFAVLASVSGKRIRWLYFVVMVSSITFFNLLTPLGELLFQIGPLRITRGALEQGLMKGFAIVGLVFISLFAVRADLRLPGAFGGLLARLFFYFERILEGRKRISARRLVATVDEVLLEMYPVDRDPALIEEAPPLGGSNPGLVGTEASARGHTNLFGAVVMVALVGSCWAVAVLSMLGKM